MGPVLDRLLSRNDVECYAAWARILGTSEVLDNVANFVLCPNSGGCNIDAQGNIGAGSANYGYIMKCGSLVFFGHS